MSLMAKDRRRSELAKIHVGAKQLFDDDKDQREMLHAVAGVRSATCLHSMGAQSESRHTGSSNPVHATPPIT